MPPPNTQPPTWRTTIHLTLPLLLTLLTIHFLHPNADQTIRLSLLLALPMHLLSTLLYRPNPTPITNPTRFSRLTPLHRVPLLFAYGRLFGTPFRLNYLLSDLVMSYTIGDVLLETEEPRRSEFLVHLLWVLGSGVLEECVPGSWGRVKFVTLALDRMIWRACWVGLVDDVVGVLGRPEGWLASWRGRGVVVFFQAVVFAAAGVVGRRCVDMLGLGEFRGWVVVVMAVGGYCYAGWVGDV